MNNKFPYYIPFHYRLFLKLRKAYRQTTVRLMERSARRNGPAGIVPDGEAFWPSGKENLLFNPENAINKAGFWFEQDLEKKQLQALAKQLEELKEKFKTRKLYFANTAGTFLQGIADIDTERRKVWENVWTIYHSGVKPEHRVLDIGGASTIFSFYLASIGCSVSVVDNDWGNCGTIYNANYVAKQMDWDLKAYDRDAAQTLPFPDGHFGRVFSICTLEHLTSEARRSLMREVGRVLKPDGIAALTIDYCHDRQMLISDKGLRFAYKRKLEEDVIAPSGLDIFGNEDLKDISSEKNFLGALFLKKP